MMSELWKEISKAAKAGKRIEFFYDINVGAFGIRAHKDRTEDMERMTCLTYIPEVEVESARFDIVAMKVAVATNHIDACVASKTAGD